MTMELSYPFRKRTSEEQLDRVMRGKARTWGGYFRATIREAENELRVEIERGMNLRRQAMAEEIGDSALDETSAVTFLE
jgi:hypothetical protein